MVRAGRPDRPRWTEVAAGYAIAVATVLPRRVYLAIGLVLTHPRFHPIHRRLFGWTGGRGPVGRALGMDMLLVETRGRRTGEPRIIPLGAVRDGRTWIVIASNAGKDRMPAWAHNLRADPAVVVEHGGRRTPHVAREATDAAEYDRLWTLVTAAYPGYDVYRERTERRIPLFVLEPSPPRESA
jgi:deazaflavin-dependent oxidoreductase (nitroreductase family)